jgi:hypothetical protein
MDNENKEKLKKAIMSELRSFCIQMYIAHNEEPTWIMECARVLGRPFAFVATGKDSYHITFSAERMYDIIDTLDLIYRSSKFEYEAHSFIDSVRREMGEARAKCDAIIQVFKNRAEDERKVLEERLQLEADYRYNNQRRY